MQDMPRIGFGTWKRAGEGGYREVLTALEVGYRHIDTAEAYDNEEEVGKALAASGLAREAVFITSKVAPEHLGPGRIASHLRASLDKLGLDQLDLYLVHWPSLQDRYDVADYVRQMMALQDQGLCRHIGVSNFTKRHLAQALEVLGSRPLATHQVEVHPLFQNRLMRDHCRGLGLPLTAYSPLARGAVNDSAVLQTIAKRTGATPGQVALAFLLAEGHSVIPTSSNRQRMAENLAAGALQLSDADMAAIRALDEGRRLVNGSWAPAWDTQ
jgi:2,5-diketo-D-gluconate reductase B